MDLRKYKSLEQIKQMLSCMNFWINCLLATTSISFRLKLKLMMIKRTLIPFENHPIVQLKHKSRAIRQIKINIGELEKIAILLPGRLPERDLAVQIERNRRSRSNHSPFLEVIGFHIQIQYRIRRCLVPLNDRDFAKLGGRD